MTLKIPADLKSLIAKQGIVVYKTVLTTDKEYIFKSSFYYFEYKQGIQYETTIERHPAFEMQIITEGFHSYKHVMWTEDPGVQCWVKCLIPAGTLYFLYDNTYVSEKIIIESKEINWIKMYKEYCDTYGGNYQHFMEIYQKIKKKRRIK